MRAADLFAGAMLALYSEHGECDDAFYRTMPLFMTSGTNDRPIQFGPWKSAAQEPLTGWAIVAPDGVLDAGLLSKPRRPRKGDRVIFPRGGIKSAIAGDVLGITAVFMPSGYVVEVPPATPGAGGGGALAYPEQEIMLDLFWLPKRRWEEMPRTADVLNWQKRLGTHEVGVREVMRRRQQELVVAGIM